MAKRELNKEYRQQAHDKVDKVMDKAEQLNEKSRETLNHLKEKSKMMRKNLDDHIIKKPEQSVLIAAGIGMAIGALVTAALMRKRK